ncbi:uncharacterized protein LOC112045701 [Bicyclus anynana]|uniref:Uncharacterized protein LOC112045701 n=1 Tax=Bicyclus anynana TaxID=110368 RepID=A0A6J1MXU6_BICAN|nr:uncharacterized protein LOC112045701 [Bicyclus anynana]
MESETSYHSIKNNPKFLLSLKSKYVHIQLIQNRTINGFIQAIDPEGHSIILLEPRGESYRTILIPGHSVLDLSITDPSSDTKPPKVHALQPSKIVTDLVPKRRKLMSWLKRNRLSVIEKDNNIVLGNVLILPPYDATCIYSTNVIVARHVKGIVDKMPDDFVET